ncbi:MAG: adenine phosphoribosyltransferase [Dehalococcoidia bacterium]|nr:adenine phosphoribosyltransferase [Dehalococcoidia bacterium]
MDLKKYIRDIPDFPQKGVLFKDITPLLGEPKALKAAIDKFAALYKDQKIETVVGIESRGFIFGAPLSYKLGVPFVPVRKKGKLPSKTISAEYSLEYGTSVVEMHEDAIKSGKNVLIIDDLLATGGTAAAAASLVKSLGCKVVGLGFLIELKALKGRERLKGYKVNSLIQY